MTALKLCRSGLLPFCVAYALATAFPAPTFAGAGRTQNVALHKGWNAIFLEVTPSTTDPEALFAQVPVTTVATFLSADKPVQFIRNPDSVEWNKEGWGVWYAANRPEAFLSSLHALYGHQAYLIQAQRDFVWTVAGEVLFEPLRWKSDSFNLVGFSVDEVSPPTFGQFFAGSPAHQGYRVFRLSGDTWTPVSDPISARMRSGEAFWVYCDGRSEFQGPLNARIAAGQRVDFGERTDAWIQFRNDGQDPMNIEVETVQTESSLPVSFNVLGVKGSAMDYLSFPLPAVHKLPTLEPGSTFPLWLNLNREQMTAGSQARLLRVSSDSGAVIWIPVIGSRPGGATAR